VRNKINFWRASRIKWHEICYNVFGLFKNPITTIFKILFDMEQLNVKCIIAGNLFIIFYTKEMWSNQKFTILKHSGTKLNYSVFKYEVKQLNFKPIITRQKK